MNWIKELFGTEKPVIAMCHLRALPGDPLYKKESGMQLIIAQARRDIIALKEGGVDGILFSNEFSFPYMKKVETITVASISRIIGELRNILDIPFGVDCMLDPIASIDIATATDAAFVRGIVSGVYTSDYGLWDTSPGDVARHAANIGVQGKIKLLCCIMPGAAQALGHRNFADIINSTIFNIQPDGICLSGLTAGKALEIELLESVCALNLDVPIFCDGGCNKKNVGQYLKLSDGIIVGTTFKTNGIFKNSVDPIRVKEFIETVRMERTNC